MRAAWYDEQGPAAKVLQVGELPDPEPGPGEVRVSIAVSAVHVGDLGKRQGWWGSTMTYPRVIPHGDGAGIIGRVGAGVDAARVGERVWVYLAQSYRPFGTAAEFVVVPAEHAVAIPAELSFDDVAGLGIPGITGHRAVFAAGPVEGRTIVVTGALGAVGRAALAVAKRGGAKTIAVVRRSADLPAARELGADHTLAADHTLDADSGLVAQVNELVGPDGVDLVAEVAFDTGLSVDVELLRYGGTITTYATRETQPTVPYWELAFKNLTLRFLSNDDFPEEANRTAAADLTAAVQSGDLRYPIAARLPLDQIATAHDLAETTPAGHRVLITP
ncbi:NADPH:quinone reductase [Kribbella sp. NPDC051718]|uniref:NADPH:quinone reductase n=1 Tax=Kribbella sp. NPDC051718 TaxID=3155168 RepID=UPI0034365EC6